ncbi:PEP-CTERM sorting domain-containing protein [Nostoc sp. NMS4]|uniref:YncE family protein n=1 Tax=Nostoc sp. NMS4 TaxID=2815390 RepID=UPI0025FA85FC|nr:PEP-CTERM sorting domain-containing protein [Nostoc sp. NMS4]
MKTQLIKLSSYMNFKHLLLLALPCTFGLVVSTCTNQAANAASLTANSQLIDTIPVPPGNPLQSFDVSFVDSKTGIYYLSDRANSRVDLINTRTDQLIGSIPGFSGFPGGDKTIGGPNGIFTVNNSSQLFADNGDSTVKVVDLTSDTIINSISTGGQKRADEGAYDPQDGIALVINGADSSPFGSLISTSSGTVTQKIQVPGATGGLEAPTWDSANDQFYLSVPELNGSSTDGGVAQIDPKTRKVVNVFSLRGCSPAGIAANPTNQHLLLGCDSKGLLVNATNGSIIASFPEVGGADQVWYNPGDNRFYLGAAGSPNGSVLGIIDGSTDTLLQTIPTAPGAKAVSVDSVNNRIFVALTPNFTTPNCTNGCIGVYADVPEPSEILGTLALGAIGAGYLVKRQFNKAEL